jgi:hypothetical protein
VAAVDNSGFVNALSEGSAVITANSVSTGGVKGIMLLGVTSKDESDNNRAARKGGGGNTGAGIAIILILAALLVKRGRKL